MAKGAVCTTSYGNTGVKCDKGDVRGVPVGLLLTTKSQQFDSPVDWASEANHDTAIKTKIMFPINDFLEFDDNTEESIIYTSGLGVDVYLRDGKYKFTFRANYGIAQDKELQKFLGMKGRAYVIDSNGLIWGWMDSSGVVQGFSIASLIIENKKVPGTDAPGWSVINVTFGNSKEWKKYFELLDPDFSALNLTGLSNVDVAVVGTPTATEIILSVGYPTGKVDGDGAIEYIPMAGIPLVDFEFLKIDGTTVQTPDSIVEISDGKYKFAFTALEAGTGDLVTPENQTNEFLIESTEAVSFTI